MKQKIVIACGIGIVVIAAVVGAYWLGHSQAKTSTPPGTTASNVHLIDYTDNDGAESTVALSGAIGDFGNAIRSDDHGAVMTLNLSHGTFQLDITDLAKRFTTVVGTTAFNRATCSGNVSVAGPASIVANSGTGAYKGVSGSFLLTMNLDETVTKQQNCDAHSKMLGQIIVSSGWGKVSL
ncbi:MAG TPA: hypothetical protein VLF60_02895 [Candidatus Saccharimonadales bacterium]|nr:hypothetical protein [Candidatus Saccharimonadales bacterium]